MTTRTLLALGGSLLMGIAGASSANANPPDVDLHAELAAVKAQLAEIKAAQNDSWLEQRRAEQVKALIRDVLSDADTRASLLENGATAGHNGKHFFLASDDGGFLLQISGVIQMRHIASFQDSGPAVDDDNEFGFAIARTQMTFDGHIADPRLKYLVRLTVDRENNNVSADRIKISYDLMDGVTVWGGEDKAPFLREELTDDHMQLAGDRSYVNELLSPTFVQGIGFTVDGASIMDAPVMVAVAITDGYRSGHGATSANPFTQAGTSQTDALDANGLPVDETTAEADLIDHSRTGRSKDFNDDDSDFAISARADMKLLGDWAQKADFSAWDGEATGMFVGAGIHYEVGETGDSALNNDVLAWTVDASVECNGSNLYAAIVSAHTDLDDNALSNDLDVYGVVVQGGYMVIPNKLEPFVRWEFLDFDNAFGSDFDEANLVTIGANYYLNSHNAKFTLDVVWALDPLPAGAEQIGLQADDADSDKQIVLRAQFQLLF